MDTKRDAPASITDLDVRAIRGRFLITTRSKAVYTVDCFAMREGQVVVSGGSHELESADRIIEGGVIRLGYSIIFAEDDGNSTSVRGIYDISHMPPHHIARLGKDVL